MELERNKLVVFSTCKLDYSQVRWSEKQKSWFMFVDGEKEFSTTVIDKPAKKPFAPSVKNCVNDITDIIDAETEKAYVIVVGDNGLHKNYNEFREYIARSICLEIDSRVYAPTFAIKSLPFMLRKQIKSI